MPKTIKLKNNQLWDSSSLEFQKIPYKIGLANGWYLVLSGQIYNPYSNVQIVLLVSQLYSGGLGILHINLRKSGSDNIVIFFRWLVKHNLTNEDFKLDFSNNKFKLYVRTIANYQQYSFRILDKNNLNNYNDYNIFKFNNPDFGDTIAEPAGVNPS